MPIKTVHITNYYHKNSGGISTSYNALMKAAERRKREMRLIVPGERTEIEIVNDYAKIYYIEAPKSFLFDKRYRVLMPWTYLPNGSPIRKILMEEQPDIVEITDKYTLSMFGAMVRRGKFSQLGRPMLVHFSCERMDDNVASFLSKGSLGKRLARAVMGYYNLPSFDFHIANSPYTAEEFFHSAKSAHKPSRSKWLANKTWRFFRSPRVAIEDRIVVCPRGVDAERFSPDRKSERKRSELVEKHGLPENAKLVLYAGRISPEKNIELLVDVMSLLASDKTHDFRLLVAGDGPLADWLEETTEKRFPGRIVQLGHLEKEDLSDLYANVDVFVHPNPKEPFGIGPLEAMASGAPCVIPNAGGVLFYATDDNTWLVEPSPEKFAEAIREVLDDPFQTDRKVKEAIETAARNTRIKSTDNLIDTYDRLFEEFKKEFDLYTNEDLARQHDFTEFL
ncbi:MAG: glycosyltransferase [Pyrinomonadaceae bacterium]